MDIVLYIITPFIKKKNQLLDPYFNYLVRNKIK